jgi:hypothetical protein
MESISEITYDEAVAFLLPRHYSGRKPVVSKAFGLVEDGILKAVITYGKPASPSICKGLCGEQYSDSVYELNRMCRVDDYHKPLSHFVSTTLRMLKPLNWIVVSYSDTAMNHHGYVYQACNFLYTGTSAPHADKYVPDGSGHNRHAESFDVRKDEFSVERSIKHRYVYFCTKSKRLKKEWMKSLRYPVLPYPKGDNSNYELGKFIGKTVVNNATGEIIVMENKQRIERQPEQTYLF